MKKHKITSSGVDAAVKILKQATGGKPLPEAFARQLAYRMVLAGNQELTQTLEKIAKTFYAPDLSTSEKMDRLAALIRGSE